MAELEKQNILLVDDRPENLLALETILENPELNIVKATSGKEALWLLLEYKFALVILDVQMPDMDGFETAELIRGKEKTKHIPIIFVTAISKEQKYVFKGYQAGAVDYLFKPIEPAILKSKVNIFLELHKQNKLIEKQAAELRKSEARKGAILVSAFDCIISIDHQGKIIEFNPAAEKTFGYTRAEVMGKSMAELIVPPSLRRKHHRGMQHYLATNEGPILGHPVESTAMRADGSEFPIEISITTIRLDKKPLFTGFLRDISERKQAQEKLEQTMAELERSNSELQQFAYIASHDLQEPLRMVASYTQLLAKRYQGKLDADADDFIAFAVDGATRMQALINDLLTYSRVGTRGEEFGSTDCETMLEKTLANLQVAIEESGTLITHDPLPTVTADASQLGQVLQNLIGNAIKFHGEETPRVHISAEQKNNTWVFEVRDNGIGIAQKYLERIFVIFQRLHTREEYAGTGIGLAVCKRIVERHKGRIWVESEPGKGTSFYFTIPTNNLEG